MKTPNWICQIIALLFASATAAFAQLEPPEPSPIVGPRMPALSPDGKRMAFVYRGDVWVASSEGGRAIPVAAHLALDAHPLFSPDGKWLAFASQRHGNWDVFVVPAAGGATRRMTWHAGTDIAHAWSPDGKELVVATRRDSPNYQLLGIDVNSLALRELTQDYAKMNYPSFSPDGAKLIYGRYGFPWTRPRYIGSAAMQVWMLDEERGIRYPLTRGDRQHLWPRFLPGGDEFLAVTVGDVTPSSHGIEETHTEYEDDPLKTPNLWAFDLEGNGRQITEFVGHGVRWPTVARGSGDIAFEYGHDIYRMRSLRRKPTPVKFFAAKDEKENSRRYEKLTKGVTEAEPSPDGKTVAFGLKGDIWTVAIKKPDGVAGRSAQFARRLTHWEGDDSDFLWSLDNQKIYFVSDRKFNYGIYEVTLDGGNIRELWQKDESVTHIRLSPDGKRIAFWVTGVEGGLYVLDLESLEHRRIAHVPGPQWRGYGGGSFSWSPDGKWIAFDRAEDNGARNIWIVCSDGCDPVKITRLNAHHSQPAWSPDGRYLLCYSSRGGPGIYVVPLQPEIARTSDIDIEFEKPGDDLEVEIDFEDIHRRIRKLHSKSNIGDLQYTAKGLILFRSGDDIYSLTYDGKTARKLSSKGGNSLLRPFSDGSKATFARNGEIHTMRIGTSAVAGDKVTFTADWERDIRAERHAAFTEFWRSYARGFYDEFFHGRDWKAIRKHYEPLLESIDTGEELATLLNMMVGELETSHSEVKAAPDDIKSAVTPRLGFTFDYSHAGPGIKVGRVPDKAPGSFSKTEIKPGEYIVAINGEEVSLNEKFYQLVNHKDDRELELLVNDKPNREDARTVKYKVMDQREWLELNYRNRVERLRHHTEEKTDGKIGYLHIESMGLGDRTRFEQEAYEYILGKEAMVIDVRFNTGGNISDTLIDWLERKQHGWWKPRDQEPRPAPVRAWNKPVIVLANEHSYSNAEMFPNAMRARGLGRVVGWQTPGYVIWTHSFKLVDGTSARMPGMGVYRLDGSPMENRGEVPDFPVWLHPDDHLAGRDPQLDKAIELLLDGALEFGGQ